MREVCLIASPYRAKGLHESRWIKIVEHLRPVRQFRCNALSVAAPIPARRDRSHPHHPVGHGVGFLLVLVAGLVDGQLRLDYGRREKRPVLLRWRFWESGGSFQFECLHGQVVGCLIRCWAFCFFCSPVRDWLTDRIGPKAHTSIPRFIECKEHWGRAADRLADFRFDAAFCDFFFSPAKDRLARVSGLSPSRAHILVY